MQGKELKELQELNERPIIGILSQELSDTLEEWYGDNYTSYIGAAYIKYVEAAGARVVPVLINQPDEYYEIIFNSTNGLLIPGGAVSLDDSGKQLCCLGGSYVIFGSRIRIRVNAETNLHFRICKGRKSSF